MRLAVVALCLLLVGCTVTVSSNPVPDPAMPTDRDEAAVLAALRIIDACELVDGLATGLGPHRCRVRSGGYEFLVRLGAGLDSDARIGRYRPKPYRGAKAYVQRRETVSCAAHLPVSFTLSIRFDVVRGPCRALDRVLATAAIRIPTLRPVELPMAGWDACTLLDAALPRFRDGYELDLDRLGDFAMDGCVADDDLPSYAPVLRLALSYGPDPTTTDAVDGMPVRVEAIGSQCQLTWSNGPAGAVDQLIAVRAPDCDTAREVTSGVLAAWPEPPPVEPQRPVLYTSEEPDLPVVRACLPLRTLHCRAFDEDVRVPRDPADIPAAAVEDADVSCAVALDPVRERFGGDVGPPVNVLTSCAFTESTGTLRVGVQFRPRPEREPVRTGQTRTTVAGRPAWTAEVTGEQVLRDIEVVLPSGHRLAVYVEVGPPRDLAPLDHVRGIAEDIVTTYLT